MFGKRLWHRLTNRPSKWLIEDRLKALFHLHAADRPVSDVAVAQAWRTSPAETQRTLKELVRRGLVRRTDEGIQLTPQGSEKAVHLIRAHRLWETYLVDREKLALEVVHERANQLEHTTTPQEAASLAEALGHPRRDPHGDPIPTLAGEIDRVESHPLTEWPSGIPATVVHVEDEPTTLFPRITALGLRPGVHLTVEDRDSDRIRVRINGQLRELETDAAANVFVVETTQEAQRLSELKPGQRAIVLDVLGDGPAHRRMLDMGLVPGARVEVVRTAPLGDPVEFRIKGSYVAMRREEADNVMVEVEKLS